MAAPASRAKIPSPAAARLSAPFAKGGSAGGAERGICPAERSRTFESYSDRGLGQVLSELADHFFKAAPGGEVEKAIEYAVKAGEHATTLLAYEEAAAHYERAVQLLALKPSDDAERCDLLLALGEAQSGADEPGQARGAFQ
ncbi:MAG: hypothetical protein ACREQ3_06000 [Candidatus Binatia bacterium]